MASGDTLEVKIIHPSVGSREFAVKGGEDVPFDLGGYKAEMMMNGNQTGHKSLEVKPWKITPNLETVPGDGGLEFLQDIANSPELAEVTWSHINGSVYRGLGTITDELDCNTKEGYTPVTISGVGKLEQIA